MTVEAGKKLRLGEKKKKMGKRERGTDRQSRIDRDREKNINERMKPKAIR